MTSNRKDCQNCKQPFTIEPEDFDFYPPSPRLAGLRTGKQKNHEQAMPKL